MKRKSLPNRSFVEGHRPSLLAWLATVQHLIRGVKFFQKVLALLAAGVARIRFLRLPLASVTLIPQGTAVC